MGEELQRIIHLVEPEYTNVIKDIKTEEKDFFIYRMTLAIKRGLNDWRNVKRDLSNNTK